MIPSGIVTFLFTDIEGSTRLWEQYPDVMKPALARHDAILKEVIEANHGHFIKTTGDGVHAVFATAPDAVHAAISAQRTFAHPLIESFTLKVRMGLHTGEAESRDGDYFGPSLNRAARIMSAGHGGQILISEVTAQMAREALPTEISLLDLGEHYLKGLVRAEKIFQISAPGLEKEFPALRSTATATNNLPPQLTSFIGRERERREVQEKLKSCRLLTLIGPGGTGKTRLSLQLGAQVLPDFADGVWFVELAPLADPAFILQTIASVLNLRAQIGISLKDILVDYLRAKNILLIFDNCEHLVEACAQLADELLRTAPGLKIIASSREALGINGETIYRVASLSLPDPGQTSLEALDRFESIQLFVERARAVNPSFELTEKNAASIAQICRRLDGIPLALELAAARVSVFSAEQISARLDDRFRLLTGGSRTALPRQQTLRALIDWSYDNLGEDERALLRRLSVFAGGWSFEAAEAICSKSEVRSQNASREGKSRAAGNDDMKDGFLHPSDFIIHPLDVLNLLTQLVNKSLVVADADNESGQARYRLLETIRQYARDKLLDVGESSQARTLHLHFFLKFAEEKISILRAQNRGQDAVLFISQFDVEYDNFRAAFEWALDQDVNASLRFIRALVDFWFRSGHGVEGIQWANDALAWTNQLPIPENEEAAHQQISARLNALTALAWLSYTQGDNTAAIESSAKAIPLARQLDDKRNLTLSLTLFGSAKMSLGDAVGARSSIEEAVALARESKEKFGLGMALGMLAMVVSIANNDFAAGKVYEAEALANFNLNEKTWDAIAMAFGAARGAMFRGEYDVARERFIKLLPAFQEMRDQHRVNMIYSELAHMDRYEGKYQIAEAAYRKTIMVWQKLGHRPAIAHQLESFAFIAKTREQVERAVRLFGAAEALREKINIPMNPRERTEYDHQLADLRAGMDEKTFIALHAEGRAMTMEEAIEYAIGSQGAGVGSRH